MPRITLNGFYCYDHDLLDHVKLPAGMRNDYMTNAILELCGDLFPYYQTAPRLKYSIAAWFDRMRPNFMQMYRALTLDYNPIENYDRIEDSQTDSAGNSETLVSAYNSSSYEPNSSGNSSGKTNYTSRIHGNIGVTTAPQMINQELALREYDLYKRIAQLFEKEFIVQVY